MNRRTFLKAVAGVLAGVGLARKAGPRGWSYTPPDVATTDAKFIDDFYAAIRERNGAYEGTVYRGKTTRGPLGWGLAPLVSTVP